MPSLGPIIKTAVVSLLAVAVTMRFAPGLFGFTVGSGAKGSRAVTL